MNLSYSTQLPFQQPASTRQQALQGLASAPQHQSFGSAYGDLNRAFAAENIGDYNRAADQANFNYAQGQLGARQALSLSGLRNMSAERQRQRDLGTARLQNARGALNALL